MLASVDGLALAKREDGNGLKYDARSRCSGSVSGDPICAFLFIYMVPYDVRPGSGSWEIEGLLGPVSPIDLTAERASH